MIQLRMFLAFHVVLLFVTTTEMMPFKQRFRISGTIELDLDPIDEPSNQVEANATDAVTGPSWQQNTCVGCAEGQKCQIYYKLCPLNKDCLIQNEECKFIPCDPMNICISDSLIPDNSKSSVDEPSATLSVEISSTQISIGHLLANTINSIPVDSLTTSVANIINFTPVEILTTSVANTIDLDAEIAFSASFADNMNIGFTKSSEELLLSDTSLYNLPIQGVDDTNIYNIQTMSAVAISIAQLPKEPLLSNELFVSTSSLNIIQASTTEYDQYILLSPSSTLQTSATVQTSISGCSNCLEGQVCEKFYIPSPYSYDECLNIQTFDDNISCPFPDTEQFRCIQYLSPQSTNVEVLSPISTAISPAKAISPFSSQSSNPISAQVLITTTPTSDPCNGTCLTGQTCQLFYPPCFPPSESCLQAQLLNPTLNCGWSRCNPFYLCLPGEDAEVSTSRTPNVVRDVNASKTLLAYSDSLRNSIVDSDQISVFGSETNFKKLSTDLVEEKNNLATPLLSLNQLINSLATSQTTIIYARATTFEILPQSDLITSGLSSGYVYNSIPVLPSFLPPNMMASPDGFVNTGETQTSTSQLQIPAQMVGSFFEPITITSLDTSTIMATTPLTVTNMFPLTELMTGHSTTQLTSLVNNDNRIEETESVLNSFFETYTAVTSDTIDLDTIANLPILQVSNTNLDINSINNEMQNQMDESPLTIMQSESNKISSSTFFDATWDTENNSYLPLLQSISSAEVHVTGESNEMTINVNLPASQQTQDSYTDELNFSPSSIEATLQELSISSNYEQSLTIQTMTTEPNNEANELTFVDGPMQVTQPSVAPSTELYLQPSSNELSSNITGYSVATETLTLIYGQTDETNLPLYTFDYSKAELIDQKTTSLQSEEILFSDNTLVHEISLPSLSQSKIVSQSVQSNNPNENEMIFSYD